MISHQSKFTNSFLLGTIPDFSKNTALEYLDITNNKCTGNVNLEVQLSESKLDSFIVGEIGDFSKNVNLVELQLQRNNLTGNINLDFQPSDSELNFVFFRTSARF
jgi:hypothetical protein